METDSFWRVVNSRNQKHFGVRTPPDVEEDIRNAKDLRGVITVDGCTLTKVKEIREFLRYQLAMGRRVLPMDGCDNFDYQTGCLGHEKEEAP